MLAPVAISAMIPAPLWHYLLCRGEEEARLGPYWDHRMLSEGCAISPTSTFNRAEFAPQSALQSSGVSRRNWQRNDTRCVDRLFGFLLFYRTGLGSTTCKRVIATSVGRTCSAATYTGTASCHGIGPRVRSGSGPHQDHECSH